MAANILDGKVISDDLCARLIGRVESLKQRGIVPGLAVVLVGSDPASEIYVRNKEKGCEQIGMHSVTVRLPVDAHQSDVESAIDRLNADPKIHGILVQLPLPRHLNASALLGRVLPEKDVDGFHVINAGKLLTGQKGTVPCTPGGVMEMLRRTGADLNGKEAVVIGRSNIVGKPMAMLLLNENCTVTICHSRTVDLPMFTRRADVLVCAVGKPRFVTADMVKPGAIVIDVGINRVDGRVVGDVDFDAVKDVAAWITPVPGGVGKMTITMLLENAVSAAEKVHHAI